jgi:sarcosine oxidase delta subunit
MKTTKEYFSHDFDSVNDLKLSAMVGEFHSAGYGIYWRTVEMMHKEGGHLAFNDITFSSIARSLSENPELVKNVITRSTEYYKLFFLKSEKIKSNRVLKNLKIRKDTISAKIKAGKASAEARALQRVGNSNSTRVEQNPTKKSKVKKSKVKKDKVKKENTPTPLQTSFQLSLTIPLPANVQEAAEMNQHTLTGKKNTQFVQSQWKVFLYERLNDPPEKQREYRHLSDITSYFLNWIRNKKPTKQDNPENESGRKYSAREEEGAKIIFGG